MALPPKPPNSRPNDLDEELREYLKEQRQADIKGTLDRLADVVFRHDAEDKERHNELRGDVRGLSLRVGAIERTTEKHAAKIEVLEKVAERHAENLEDSQKWIIGDLEKRVEEHTWLRRNAVAIVASGVAALSTLYSLLKMIGVLR